MGKWLQLFQNVMIFGLFKRANMYDVPCVTLSPWILKLSLDKLKCVFYPMQYVGFSLELSSFRYTHSTKNLCLRLFFGLVTSLNFEFMYL